MGYPELSRGDRGEEVKLLQSLLNRVGAMLIADGDFGSGTERGVRYAQELAGQQNTGTVTRPLWVWLEEKPDPYPLLDTNGVAFIASEETGGLSYYQEVCRWPHYPGHASGVTIGIGFDLRFNSDEQFRQLWENHLPRKAMDELARDIGRAGSEKRVKELKRLGIEIPFASAWAVFIDKTLPLYYLQTETIFPSLATLPGLCRSVLVSIVFNRGNSLDGPGRKEMRAIRDILARAADPHQHKRRVKMILEEVEDQIVAMKRLWNPASGVYKRRQAEANLWRTGLKDW